MTKIKSKCFFEQKRPKRALMLVVMMLITLALSGCENFVETDVSAETKSIIQTVSETTNNANIAEIKTIEPPEDGWTWEQLSDVIYINNKKIESDITYQFLEDMFTFENLTYYKKMSTASAFLNYNDKYAFSVAFYYNAPQKINKNSIVKNLVFSAKMNASDIPNEKLISINGIGLGNNYEDMILQLGFPTEIDGNTNIYNLEEDTIAFFLDDEKIINVISIILEE